MGQKGDLHYAIIGALARHKSEVIRKTHPKRNFILFRNKGDPMSSWSAEQTLQEAKRTDLILFLDWNQSRYLRTYKRHMVGQVRLVLQRILSRFLFFDLTLFHRQCWITFTGDFGQRLNNRLIPLIEIFLKRLNLLLNVVCSCFSQSCDIIM